MEYISVAKKASLWTPALPPKTALRLIWTILGLHIKCIPDEILNGDRELCAHCHRFNRDITLDPCTK